MTSSVQATLHCTTPTVAVVVAIRAVSGGGKLSDCVVVCSYCVVVCSYCVVVDSFCVVVDSLPLISP